MRRRRSVVPFSIANGRKISSISDLKEILSDNPEALVDPLMDGRLRRFLKGISDAYLKCIDENDPEGSLRKLAKMLGIEIQKEISPVDSYIVSSPEEIKSLIEKGEEQIKLSTGKIQIEKLVISKPVQIIGKGQNVTLLKIGTLEVKSKEVSLKNLTCEVENIILKEIPTLEKAHFSVKNFVSPEWDFIRGVDKDLSPKRIEIIVEQPIVVKDKEVMYDNVDFIFKNDGEIVFENCQCSITNCTFVRESVLFSKEKSTLSCISLKGSSRVKIDSCEFSQKDINFSNVQNTYKLSAISVSEHSCLELINSSINGLKSPDGRGSGIIGFDDSQIEVDKCEFRENERGIEPVNNTKLKVTNSKFIGHKKPDGKGQGIIGFHDSQIEVDKCEFRENERGIEPVNNTKLKVTNSKFIGHKKPDGKGQGIIGFHDSQIEVDKCEFRENESGIWVENNSKLKVTNSKFIGHKKPDGKGPGIIGFHDSQIEVDKCEFRENERGIEVQSNTKLKVTNSKFIGHKEPDGKGPGIIGFHDSQIEVDKCEFRENERGIEPVNNTKLKVTNSKFIGHKKPDGKGQGIIGFHDSQIEVDKCEFRENERGIEPVNNTKLKVTNSKFIGHKKPDGKGQGIIGFHDSQIEVDKCEFRENESGIWLQNNTKLKVTNSKFIGHKKPDGKGPGIIGFDDSQIEVDKCEFRENERGIWVENNSKLKVTGSVVDKIYCDSPNILITDSKVKIIEYKGESKKPTVKNSKVSNWKDVSGCYITTAVCFSLGKDDNCYELNMFRQFRDNWLIYQPDGKQLIDEYYQTAPLIIKSIDSHPERKKIYFQIWKNYLKPCLKLLERGEYTKVKSLYIKMVNELRKQFLEK